MSEEEEVREEVVEESHKKVMEELEKLYEDEDIEVYAAPDDNELERLILEILREKPMKFKELKEVFSATAGEDRLRRALTKLIENQQVRELENGVYSARPEDLIGGVELELPPEEEEEEELEETFAESPEEEELTFEEVPEEDLEDIDEEILGEDLDEL